MVRKDRVTIDAIKNYQPSDIKDIKHDTEIEHMFYLSKLQDLLVMEKDARRFKVYNARTGKWKQNVPEKTTGNSGAYTAADYVHIEGTQVKLVATATNNQQLYFWESQNYIWRDRTTTIDLQLAGK